MSKGQDRKERAQEEARQEPDGGSGPQRREKKRSCKGLGRRWTVGPRPGASDATMAVFCDFENVALGVRDAKYDRLRHPAGARAPAAQGQHRRQEGLLRLGPLQGVQGADCTRRPSS